VLNSKKKSFFIDLYWSSLWSSLRESLDGSLHSSEGKWHQPNEEKFRTTKPQESVELTVDKIKLSSSNRDIGRNVSHMDHVLHTWVVYQKPLQLQLMATSKKLQ
jgi:hypothetical protein